MSLIIAEETQLIQPIAIKLSQIWMRLANHSIRRGEPYLDTQSARVIVLNAIVVNHRQSVMKEVKEATMKLRTMVMEPYTKSFTRKIQRIETLIPMTLIKSIYLMKFLMVDVGKT